MAPERGQSEAARTVSQVGEFALIEQLALALGQVGAAAAPDLVGIGDDAAIWTPTPDTRAVITTDSLIAGIHFRLDWTDWRDLGHKALAVNLSDIAAMGARPRLAVISLGLTGAEPVAGLLDLYRGMGTLAAEHGVVIAGGDVVASPDRLGLHVTVIGESWPEARGCFLTRDGARAGDLLGVSGPLGLSAAGLRVLLAGASGGNEGDESALLRAHHRPEPRVAYGRMLVTSGASGGMDLSDGLWGDLAKLCARSRVGARVEAAALPVPAAVREQFPDDWLALATRGGEDYELLFTLPPEALAGIEGRCVALGLPVPVIIGAIVAPMQAGGVIALQHEDGRDEVIGGGAFDHFARR